MKAENIAARAQVIIGTENVNANASTAIVTAAIVAEIIAKRKSKRKEGI